jgi:hypothetical protein
VDVAKYREWIYTRQGLAGPKYRTAPEALAGSGWARSVGGVNPYLAIRARSGEGRAEVDAQASDLQLFELPSARGCTYVIPAAHFGVGLAIGRRFGAATEAVTARKLGVEDAEVESLKSAVLGALAAGPSTPADLKTTLGDTVRNLGDEGKRRGMITTLPLALGLLQAEGRLRRKPANGRLDTQRYAYELWQPPLDAIPDDDAAAEGIARLFFAWTGAATLKEFREFTAFTLRDAQPACERAGIVDFEPADGLLSLPGARAEFDAFLPTGRPAYALVGNLDAHLLLRRGASLWLEEAGRARQVPTDKGIRSAGELAELWSHAILDRGRLIGLWEFDADEGRIAWTTWVPADDALRACIEKAERYIREELGDARSFSLDSPASRRPRIKALRAMSVK